MDISPKHEAEVCVECFVDLLVRISSPSTARECPTRRTPQGVPVHDPPVNHPVTRYVRRDVTSILEGNELNTLCSGQDTSLGLAHLNPKPGVTWEPYGGTRARQEADGQVLGGHGVYDEKMVNATASFSAFSASDNILPLISDSVIIISSYHGNLPICQGRARFNCVTTFKSHIQNFLRIVELRSP